MEPAPQARASGGASSPARPARRPRREWPFWVNALFGVMLVAVGLIFFVLPQKGAPANTRILFLVLYLILGGVYIGRAFRQYRRTHP